MDPAWRLPPGWTLQDWTFGNADVCVRATHVHLGETFVTIDLRPMFLFDNKEDRGEWFQQVLDLELLWAAS